MRSRLFLIILLLFIGLFNTFSSDYIPDDIVPNYGEVKKLLAAFSRKNAGKNESENKVVEQTTFQKSKNTAEDDKTEVSVNRKCWHEVFESDIILTLPQAKAILTDINSSRAKRQANLDPTKFWSTLTISYKFEGGEETWRKSVREALKQMERIVCFKFKENGTDRDKLVFMRKSGCSSSIGRVGGEQDVHLAPGCDRIGIIWHETLHALGLWHEQSRYDRDSHITLNTNKISKMYEFNYQKSKISETENFGQPYELGSVMHYPEDAFSRDGSAVIIAKNKFYQKTMGQRDSIAFKDAKMINTRYCSNICPQKLACLNGGYTDPLDCKKCRCPSGYKGTYCGAVDFVFAGGLKSRGVLNFLNAVYQTLKSGRVPSNITCVWRISNVGGHVELVFDDIVEPCQRCLEIKYLGQRTLTGARFCCLKPPVIQSEREDVIIIYRKSFGAVGALEGFSLKYRAVRSSSTSKSLEVSPVKTIGSSFALWSDWGEWSACSQPCGGCGTRTRVRTCYGGNEICPGKNLDRQSCNTQVCAKPKKGMICNGRLLLPCDLLAKLRFESNNYLNPKFSMTLNQRLTMNTSSRKLISSTVRRVKRQTATRLCEKRFSYQCPTALLTIEVEYKKPNLSTNVISTQQHSECCPGYYPKDGQCFKE